MYIPMYFKITDENVIDKFIEESSFGQLVSIHAGSLVSTHMPFLYDAKQKKLLAHRGHR